MANQKLELNWIDKYKQHRLEPRILIENPQFSNLSADAAESEISPLDTKISPLGIKGTNLLIHGDNLLALKALEQDYAGKVKCVYIDPPYNTGNAFTHYDDGIEHSLWLSLIKPRLEILRNLLSADGSIWISIDDDESHYLKVLCDEVFGRKNFVANVIWEKKFSPQNDTKWLSDSHDHILVYAKNKETWRPNLLPRTTEMNDRYKNPDKDPRGIWTSSDLTVKTYAANNDYPITLPSGKISNPTQSRCWSVSKERFQELVNDNRIWFGESGDNMPRLKKFLTEVQDGAVTKTIWYRTEVGDNQEAKKEIKVFNSEDVFATPKPERLIERIIFLATQSGDLVLDSFLGSGTTAAVAHKMGRRWIGIELGEHAVTHCVPRLRAVCNGSDQGGISKALAWKGGGSFRYYSLAPSLLQKDHHGQWVISTDYNATMLAAAVAKHEGFRYAPDEELFWKQSRSSEHTYLLVTTQYISRPYVEHIIEMMQPQESLLICCTGFDSIAQSISPSVMLKKIPKMLENRCDFGEDDYSFNIVNLPFTSEERAEFGDTYEAPNIENTTVKASKKEDGQASLF